MSYVVTLTVTVPTHVAVDEAIRRNASGDEAFSPDSAAFMVAQSALDEAGLTDSDAVSVTFEHDA